MTKNQTFNHPLYKADIEQVSNLNLPWQDLKNSSVMVSGATGLFGTFLIDVLMFNNHARQLGCRVIALGRNTQKAHTRFSEYWDSPYFTFKEVNLDNKLTDILDIPTDYIIHLASSTHPVAYATNPIGTITTNIIGTRNLLDYADKVHAKRFVFASSCEIYGENRNDVETFDEHYCGYIDPNTLRAGYPESKRCGEALCQAYRVQKRMETVIPRFSRSYGPTTLTTDTKASSQFIQDALNGKDIVLKSEGNQFYSYTYVADAVSGLLTIMFKGKDGEAYNVADTSSCIHLKDLAKIIAEDSGTHVVFDLPDATEKAGFSKATVACQDGSKLSQLGWKAQYTIPEGISRTLTILRESR